VDELIANTNPFSELWYRSRCHACPRTKSKRSSIDCRLGMTIDACAVDRIVVLLAQGLPYHGIYSVTHEFVKSFRKSWRN
jgi:hypothetical protein